MAIPATCPRCDGELEAGSIVGQLVFLNWVPEGQRVGWKTLGKEHLATGSLIRPPKLAAARCASCGLGVFESSVPSER